MALEDVLRNAVAPLESALRTAPLENQLERLTDQISRLQTLGGATGTSAVSTGSVVAQAVNAIPAASGSGGLGASLLSSFGLGLGITPLIRGIAGLFGGGDRPEPPPLVQFALPSLVQVNAGVSAGVRGPFSVDQGQGGVTRPVTNPAPAQVTVQVQALDTQSFLDRSGDIALAVRQAMLESSVLNDVIREA